MYEDIRNLTDAFSQAILTLTRISTALMIFQPKLALPMTELHVNHMLFTQLIHLA